MAKSFFILLAGLLVNLTAIGQAQSVKLQPVWESDTTLRTPESVLVDPIRHVLYVACINGAPKLENKSSYIAKVGLDGKVIQMKFADNLNSTKGMGILGDKLYVTEMTQVAEIALATGKILNRYPIEGAKFLNDIAVDTQKGVVYVTDSNDSKVWAITNGKAGIVLEGEPLKGTNGLLFENNLLLIGNGDGSLLSLNPTSKKLTTLAKVSGGIDGIAALGNKTYMVTEWAGKVWYIHADGTTELKLDTSPQKISSADIGYNPATHMLFVPTFFHNTVKAYTLK
ncbi:NHL repeat containing protein [Spirosoma linguale]|uniref:NHL repeat containing protein n=1 Tax=Spirosoma linguale (strain ATCC 33905 / DSM 74 / LMG 10896 / Claus 1) TaxID=504472 RepID=D2QHN4_SPILD|nr:NHL repeat containing protein [Spirosoma linguale DSM 74]